MLMANDSKKVFVKKYVNIIVNWVINTGKYLPIEKYITNSYDTVLINGTFSSSVFE